MKMGEGSEGGRIRSGDDEVGNDGVGFLGYKKVVVTGLVMSAATVLVPPLLMGLVFWGPPCAVLWGSYAFTRRVLSFLLPVPKQVQPLGVHDDDDVDYNDVDHKVEIEFEADPGVSNISMDQKPAGLDEDRNGDSKSAVKEGDEVIATEGSKQDNVDKQAGDDHQGSERSAAVTAEKPASDDEGQSDQDKSSVTATATATDQSKPGATESSKNDTAQSSDKGPHITPAKEELTKKAKIDGKEKKRHSKHGSK